MLYYMINKNAQIVFNGVSDTDNISMHINANEKYEMKHTHTHKRTHTHTHTHTHTRTGRGSSIHTSGTFFRGDLVMKTFLRPLSLFR